jgi:hypothetical protein
MAAKRSQCRLGGSWAVEGWFPSGCIFAPCELHCLASGFAPSGRLEDLPHKGFELEEN